ncbi:MAG TPA: hypothetical protein VIJ20_11230, partial [Solirubrobacteraceae bacterium]
ARDRGVHVIADPELPETCDLILAQDATTLLELWGRYPDSVRVFVCHSNVAMLQMPPQIEGACQALVVLSDRMRDWARGLAWAPRIERLRQPVDLDRFRLPPTRGHGPPRILVLSNYAFGTRARLITESCRAAGAELRWIGGRHGQTPTPEAEIATVDAVIGLGRSALDAMAATRAAMILGPIGGDGWVTPESYERLEADGFTGRGTDRVLDAGSLTDELLRWEPAMGQDARDLVARHHDVRTHASELIALARELKPQPPLGNTFEQELARLIRLEWQRSGALVSTRAENNRLSEQLHERGRREAEEVRAEIDQLRAQVQALSLALGREQERLVELRATRRWRFASAVGRPLDVLRRWRRRTTAAPPPG